MRLARGEVIDSDLVEPDRAAKSYGEENTFEGDERGGPVVTQALTSHAHAVARRLRRDALAGRTVTLKVRLARRDGKNRARSELDQTAPRYPLRTRSRTLPTATDDAAVIRRVALELWDAAQFDEPVRLVGVSVSNLLAPGAAQLDLFAAQSGDERSAKLGPALDAIRARFGEHAIQVATKDPEKLTPSHRKKARGVRAGAVTSRSRPSRRPGARSSCCVPAAPSRVDRGASGLRSRPARRSTPSRRNRVESTTSLFASRGTCPSP